MTQPDIYIDQRPISLGRRIGKGGEGEVYSLESDPSHAVKLYTVADTTSREHKIQAMVRQNLAAKAPLVAFPIAPVRRRNGAFAGFLMRLVAEHKPLHELYAPGSRKRSFPQADYRFLVRTAGNVARAVASVHASGCVIGDINHSSILISKKATVALIDADSFQVTEGAERFNCLVGVPDYTPPELQGRSLSGVPRTPNHDAFGLAIVIFQLLLMGRHPFIGTIRRGDLPQLHEAIRDYRFVYTENRDVGMDQPPGTPVLSDFSPLIAASFEQAFSKESGGQRPDAASWVSVLDGLEKSLVQCTANKLHFTPGTADECMWCEMESLLGNFLFLPYVPLAELTTHPFDPGAGGFNIDFVWRQISSIPFPSANQLQPKLAQVTIEPSQAAISAAATMGNDVWGKVSAGVLALVMVFTVPSLWIIWVPLAWYALFSSGTSKSVESGPFTRRYLEIELRWSTEFDAWLRRCGVEDLIKLQKQLSDARDSYKTLSAREKSALDTYQRERKAKQLYAFLDNYEIRKARIKGVGPAKQAALASYGIETAADVSYEKLLAVPGFGPINSKDLMSWRSKQEQRFVYSVAPNEADRQELTRIRSTIAAEASSLRKTLLAGPQNLAILLKRINQAKELEDPILNKIHLERERIKCDLSLLKIAPPPVPSATPQQPRSTYGSPRTSQVATTPTPTYSGTRTCPRCGSSMVRRTARRGSHAGSAFWGCSRYPNCRGTRNI